MKKNYICVVLMVLVLPIYSEESGEAAFKIIDGVMLNEYLVGHKVGDIVWLKESYPDDALLINGDLYFVKREINNYNTVSINVDWNILVEIAKNFPGYIYLVGFSRNRSMYVNFIHGITLVSMEDHIGDGKALVDGSPNKAISINSE